MRKLSDLESNHHHYYHGVHVVLHFHKEVGVDRKEDQADAEPDPNEEEMAYVELDDESECHWRMGFEENYGGVDDQKVIIHDKRWDVYMNKKEALITSL